MCNGVKVSDHPGTGFTITYELPCGCWALNLGPLEEQSVLLTSQPSLQLLLLKFLELEASKTKMSLVLTA